MPNRQSFAQSNYPGLLDESQAQALERVQTGLINVHRAIQRINGLIVDHKLHLRTVNAYEIGMTYGASENMALMHELAEKQLRRDCNAPEEVPV